MSHGQEPSQGKRGSRRLVGVSQVLAGVMAQAGLGHLVYEEKLRTNWSALLGAKASAMAGLESCKDGILRVKVESATWRHELSYQRETIRKRANEILGADLVKEVKLG
jgi:predicted nucleic acid-binding Zn ribbon protein